MWGNLALTLTQGPDIASTLMRCCSMTWTCWVDTVEAGCVWALDMRIYEIDSFEGTCTAMIKSLDSSEMIGMRFHIWCYIIRFLTLQSHLKMAIVMISSMFVRDITGKKYVISSWDHCSLFILCCMFHEISRRLSPLWISAVFIVFAWCFKRFQTKTIFSLDHCSLKYLFYLILRKDYSPWICAAVHSI